MSYQEQPFGAAELAPQNSKTLADGIMSEVVVGDSTVRDLIDGARGGEPGFATMRIEYTANRPDATSDQATPQA
jgi:hypothetical protein